MFSLVSNEVMAKSESNRNEKKKIAFKAEFHSLSHPEGHCFICPFSTLILGLLFLAIL